VVVDISPSQRPSTFTALARQIARLEQVPLAQMRSTRDVEKWLLSRGPPFPAPEPLTPQALGLGAFSNVDTEAPFPIPGPFLAKYFAANLVHDHSSHPTSMKWGCNLPVLSKAIRDGSISWEGQLPLIQSEVNASYRHVETPLSPALRRVESVPVHFVFGGDSPYYLEVPSVRSNIERYFARATVDVVPKAGHFVHVERPKAFNESVAAFLGRCGVA
jgi:pimeloyl-ACP methyl ester carboxylesterase